MISKIILTSTMVLFLIFSVNTVYATHNQDTGFPAGNPNYVNMNVNSDCSWVSSTDSDQDGICDSWENSGQGLKIDFTVPGTSDHYYYEYLCAPYGPDTNCPSPDKKDVYVEVDWMRFQTPIHDQSYDVLRDVKTAFANAPVGTAPNKGITLHIQYGENPSDTYNGGEIPYYMDLLRVFSASATDDGFYKLKQDRFGTVDERNANNHVVYDNVHWLTAKRQIFHYAMFIHKMYENPPSSGWAEINGNDLVVSLGAFTNEIGSVDQQKGTFMHEFGHNLGLHHGGNDVINKKPNYLSVMSYAFQFASTCDAARPLDYSSKVLNGEPGDPGLNENGGLYEPAGLGDSYTYYGGPRERVTCYSSPTGTKLSTTAGYHGVNWNNVNNIEGHVTANINNWPAGSDTSNTLLSGYNDWSNLAYDFSNVSGFGSGIDADMVVINYEDAEDKSVLPVQGKDNTPVSKYISAYDLNLNANFINEPGTGLNTYLLYNNADSIIPVEYGNQKVALSEKEKLVQIQSMGKEENLQNEITINIPEGAATPDNDLFYDPADVSVSSGSTVTWVNDDTAAHTVTSGTPDGGPDGNFDSSLFGPGKTFQTVFEEEGDYPYFCMVHPWMTGVITVQTASGEEKTSEEKAIVADTTRDGEITLEIDRQFRHLNIVAIGEAVNSLPPEAFTSDTAKSILDGEISDAISLNEIDDYDGTSQIINTIAEQVDGDGENDLIHPEFVDPEDTANVSWIANNAQASWELIKTTPEFGEIAVLALVISIIGIIAVTAKTRLKLSPKY